MSKTSSKKENSLTFKHCLLNQTQLRMKSLHGVCSNQHQSCPTLDHICSVFRFLKCHWNTTLDDFIRENRVSEGSKQFLKLFSIAWQNVFKSSTIKNGFAATGIYLFNSDVISNEAYAPNLSVETDQDESEVFSTSVPESIEESITKFFLINMKTTHQSRTMNHCSICYAILRHVIILTMRSRYVPINMLLLSSKVH